MTPDSNPITEDEAVRDLRERVRHGGRVELPRGELLLTDTLTVTAGCTRMFGHGPDWTAFRWAPGHEQPDKPLIEFGPGSSGFRLEGFGIRGPGENPLTLPGWDRPPGDGEPADAGIGLGLGYTGVSSGRVTGTGSIEDVSLNGFQIGLAVGGPGGSCASEVTYRNVVFNNCQTAAVLDGGGNTLNHRFEMLNVYRCWSGIRIKQGGSVSISSGSATNVGYYRNQWDAGAVVELEFGGVVKITDAFRSEGSPSGRLVYDKVWEASTSVTVDSCESSGGTFSEFPGGCPDAERFAVYALGNASVRVEMSHMLDTGGVRFIPHPLLKQGRVRVDGNTFLDGCESLVCVGDGATRVARTAEANAFSKRWASPYRDAKNVRILGV